MHVRDINDASGTSLEFCPPQRRPPQPESPQIGPHGDEATIYEKELNNELDVTGGGGASGMFCCSGARLNGGQACSTRPTLKGVKLDFKHIDCVEPALNYLREINAVEKLDGHLWLNADILEGPGALIPAMQEEFVRLCATALPGAVLSLSWGSSVLSTSRAYSEDMVEKMVKLCLIPSVTCQHDWEIGGTFLRTPAAACRHITFGVAVEYALASESYLNSLLARVPNSSLTIFSGSGSFSITPNTVKQLITTYGPSTLFLDLKLTKWRACSDPVRCSIQ